MLTTNLPTLPVRRRVVVIAAAALLGLGSCTAALALRFAAPVFAAAGSQPANKPVPVPAGEMAGRLKTHVNPVYPPAAKQSRIQGTVVLHAIIGMDGHLTKLDVVSGPEELRSSALEAVGQWAWEPFLVDGKAVEVDTDISVTYSLT